MIAGATVKLVLNEKAKYKTHNFRNISTLITWIFVKFMRFSITTNIIALNKINQTFENIKVVLFPPKPKEFDKTFFTSIFLIKFVTGLKLNSFICCVKFRLGNIV